MRTIKRFILAGLACLTVTAAHAGTVKYNGYLANESGVSTAKTYPLSLNSYAIDQLSFQLSWATAAPAAVTFTDGQESTTTITVTSNAGISTATATAYLTVLSTNVAGACITYFNGATSQNACNNGWRVDSTTDTATDVAAELNLLFTNIVSTSNVLGTIVYSTATLAGSAGNSMSFTSNTSSITVNGITKSSGAFSGGQDGATLYIGNSMYRFSGNVAIGAAASNSATNLAAVINASSTTTNIIASAVGAVVGATSTVVGTQMNVTIYSSTQAALTIGGSTVTVAGLGGAGQGQMWGGTNAAYTLTSGTATVISATNPYMPLTDSLGMPSNVTPTPMVGLRLLYGQGVSAITGLTDKTTYYAIPVTQGSFGLSTTSTGAVAGYAALPAMVTTNGTFIPLTSSQTKTTADSYTLTALAYSTISPAGIWQGSNDGVNWGQMPAISSQTFVSVYPSSTTVQDFGTTNYSSIRFNLNTPPTAGGLILQIIPNGKNSGL
jgi:hypothetical protein